MSLRNETLFVKTVGRANSIAEVGGTTTEQDRCHASYRITFSTESTTTDQIEGSLSGSCWHEMFRNPVITRGFRIPSRKEDHTGLEIPLNMMAGLVEAPRATTFDGELAIKGFCTMLVPTRRLDNVLYWHLLFNKDGSHISYLDDRVRAIRDDSADNSGISSLVDMRHIVGWCSIVKHFTGAPDANYDIKWTGIDQAGPGCAFEKLSITGGKFVNVGASFARGNKDTPLYLKRSSSYVEQLKFARGKFAVFYDTAECRAWLTNGASALLHLVRASLRHDSLDRLNSNFLFRFEELRETDHVHGADAAIQVLADRHNMELEVFPREDEVWTEEVIDANGKSSRETKRKVTKVRFQDRVNDIYHIFEQIQEHQEILSGPGMPLRTTPRQQLEGFDFMDIVTGDSPLIPRVTNLKPSGKGWVDFTRAIQAVTLLGRGFGDLIKPSDGSNRLCASWNLVPVGKNYLTACTSDLVEVLKRKGDIEAVPMKLAENRILGLLNRMELLYLATARGILGAGRTGVIQKKRSYIQKKRSYQQKRRIEYVVIVD
ncbi:hypothetical protein W97_03886 [Coniosporium apollinis CBS 100218]|uniref:Uncharacterized protein n=1 Tax=Coniosporium apollinis (strain CBS 100218) TaxID=1168221 RepID=R7YS40_CONA1|nr:uncharacterized protein W97_03886 [Coniosporium apollinis CBS 100218]EON64653.1 hypothetical protein W97_03886 [Coniosporium apollinis CBS 100218]